MSTRLSHIVVDANDPSRLARFWAEVLGWRIVIEDPHEVEIAGAENDVNLIFVPITDRKIVKNRLHLDLSSSSADQQRDTVNRLVGLGATHADIGQGDVPWVVLADPEGNEFCVLPPRHEHADTGPIGAICIDAQDAHSLADFWSAATGWPVVARGAYAALHSGTGPYITLGPPVSPKPGKNRIHLDIAPPEDGNQLEEVERLVALGASRVDIGQGEVRWVVLADPEGNEFCVLSPR